MPSAKYAINFNGVESLKDLRVLFVEEVTNELVDGLTLQLPRLKTLVWSGIFPAMNLQQWFPQLQNLTLKGAESADMKRIRGVLGVPLGDVPSPAIGGGNWSCQKVERYNLLTLR